MPEDSRSGDATGGSLMDREKSSGIYLLMEKGRAFTMACITKRDGQYVIDCYDQQGKRYRKSKDSVLRGGVYYKGRVIQSKERISVFSTQACLIGS